MSLVKRETPATMFALSHRELAIRFALRAICTQYKFADLIRPAHGTVPLSFSELLFRWLSFRLFS